MTSLPPDSFTGAPAYAFEAVVHVNITESESAKSWLQDLMSHSKCTYRQSKGRSPGLKRVLYKVEMHCQHAKKLTPKQAAEAANLAKGKNAKTSLMHNVRQKKTGCPSSLKLTVTRPTKKNQHGSSQQNLNCVSHPTV